jgi:beta-glucosidase
MITQSLKSCNGLDICIEVGLMAISTFDDARAAVAGGMAAVDAARELVTSLTPEERLWCLDGDLPALAGVVFQMHEGGYHRMTAPAARVDRVGIPGIAFSDGPRGAVVGNATAFPVSMARGATWDPGLEERVGEAIGRELRAAGANFTGAVCVNLLRHPAWGRAQETYGEDPHHVGEMGAAFTRGLQRHVLACVKHFACNSMENARFSVDIEIDDVALHEVFLPHFRRIVEEGVASIMSAYNAVNGEWCGHNRELLTGVLRDEWRFDGFVISDFIFGIRDGVDSLHAGLDIEMPFRMLRMQQLPEALSAGDVTWDEVDGAATRVIATLLRFDDVLSTPSPGVDVLGSAEHRALAREVAARSVVLLRNEVVDGRAVLPLDPAQSLAVIGGLATMVNLGDGGSSDVWDLDCQTLLDGLRAAAASVAYDDGSDLVRAAAVAAQADAALVVVGYTHLDEGEFIGALDPALTALFPSEDEPEVVHRLRADIDALSETVLPPRLRDRLRGFSSGGDRQSLRLKPADVELIRAVAAANPRTVVALQAGSAVVMTEWVDAVSAIVQTWYAGSRAGDGLADVLFGSVNPSARLPFSIPVDEADLPAFDRDATTFRYDRWHGWWHLSRAGAAPAFAFGFGLSYTTFQIADVSVERSGHSLTVRGNLANTGDRDGAEVVQVYAELPDPDAPQRLLGFQRLEVAAGAVTPFSIAIPVSRLATRNPTAKSWRAPRGRHRLRVARNAVDRAASAVDLEL